MAFGEQNTMVPQIPYAPQPAAYAANKEQEQNYESFLGQTGAPNLQEMAMEPTYGTMMDEEPTVVRSPASTVGGQPRNILKEIAAKKPQVQETLRTLSQGRSKLERVISEKATDDAAADDIGGLLGKAFDDFEQESNEMDPNAGYSNPKDDFMTRLKDSFSANVTRIKAGLTRDDSGVLSTWKQKFGENNVKVRDGQLWFRKDASQKFRKVDPEVFELVGDTILDGSGPIIEGLVSTGTEAGILAAAFPEGMSGVGLPLAAASVAGAGAAGGAAGAAARKGVMELAGVDDDTSTAQEIMWNAGFSGLIPGGGMIAKRGGSAIAKKVASVMENSALNRIKKLAEIRVAFDDFTKGILGESGSKGLKEAGEDLGGALKSARDKVEVPVGMVWDKAEELAKKNGVDKVPMDNLLSHMKDVLENEGVKFGENGFAEFAEKASAMVPVGAEGAKEIAVESAEALNPLGSMQGGRTMKRLVDQYNAFLGAQMTQGGISPSQLKKTMDAFRDEISLSNVPRTSREQRAFIRLREAAAGDRDKFFQQTLEGSNTQEEKLFKEYFTNYAEKIDNIVGFQTMMNKKESREQFVKALVQPNNSERIAKLKSVLGDGSKEWDSFRGEWLNEFIQKHVDPNSGVLLTSNLNQNLNSLGKNVVDTLLKPEEKVLMKKLVAKGNKIQFTDLLDQAAKDDILDLLPLTPIPQYMPARISALWNIIGGKKSAADYLLDEGFYKMAAKSADKAERTGWLEMRDFLSQMMDQMKAVNITRTNPKTGKKVKVEVLVPLVKQSVYQGLSNNKQMELPDTGGEFEYAPPPQE